VIATFSTATKIGLEAGRHLLSYNGRPTPRSLQSFGEWLQDREVVCTQDFVYAVPYRGQILRKGDQACVLIWHSRDARPPGRVQLTSIRPCPPISIRQYTSAGIHCEATRFTSAACREPISYWPATRPICDYRHTPKCFVAASRISCCRV
jgi:hypothetical protein